MAYTLATAQEKNPLKFYTCIYIYIEGVQEKPFHIYMIDRTYHVSFFTYNQYSVSYLSFKYRMVFFVNILYACVYICMYLKLQEK